MLLRLLKLPKLESDARLGRLPKLWSDIKLRGVFDGVKLKLSKWIGSDGGVTVVDAGAVAAADAVDDADEGVAFLPDL